MANDFDVIVVGAGGAGLSAAYMAAEAGARTLLIDADKHVGGSTKLSGGVLYAANTSVQRAEGVLNDTSDLMFRYNMILNQYGLNPGLIHRFCTESGPVVEWLIELGVNFPGKNLYVAGLDGIRRGHRAAGMGGGLVEVLDACVSRHPLIEIAFNTRVRALRIAAGSVTGIGTSDGEISCAAVIVTSGGFGNNPELIARYLPSFAIYGDWTWYVGSPYCRGDGFSMGIAAGAAITGFDCGTPVLTPGFGRDFEPYIPGWFIFVSHDGERFADETLDYAVSGRLVAALPGGECFAIFDEAARAGKAMTRSKGGSAYGSPSWSADRLGTMADQGRIYRAQNIASLSETAGINAMRLAATVERYNCDCDEGRDSSYFKDPELLRPIRQPPFYAVRVRPAVIGITGAGLKIDMDAHVIGQDGRPIPGLYAAGEVVGGIHGKCYVGGGGSLTSSFVFGRIGGANAAAFALRQKAN